MSPEGSPQRRTLVLWPGRGDENSLSRAREHTTCRHRERRAPSGWSDSLEREQRSAQTTRRYCFPQSFACSLCWAWFLKTNGLKSSSCRWLHSCCVRALRGSTKSIPYMGNMGITVKRLARSISLSTSIKRLTNRARTSREGTKAHSSNIPHQEQSRPYFESCLSYEQETLGIDQWRSPNPAKSSFTSRCSIPCNKNGASPSAAWLLWLKNPRDPD
jgi:hypothetical protein